MFKILEILINLLAVLAIATFAITLWGQKVSSKSNWQSARLFSNAFLIVYEIIYIAINYFSNKSVIINLIALAIWIINFAFSYYFWQNRENQ